ncbi:hypothetical protein CNO08_22180 [Lysobacter capsici]|nr:hypothetical protein CNO08_22180 [Lysobacter capsici]
MQFLRQHAPTKCNVFKGGFVFDDDGVESKQLDIIVTTDIAPRFDFHNSSGSGKAFSPVEGTLGVFSIKSTLDRKELFDALEGIASIPPMRALEGRINPLMKLRGYDDWPLKVIYASKGISLEKAWAHLHEFYAVNPSVPIARRPNFIHVAGGYLISRIVPGMAYREPSGVQQSHAGGGGTPAVGAFSATSLEPDVQAICWILNSLQDNAMASAHIQFGYGNLINRAMGFID